MDEKTVKERALDLCYRYDPRKPGMAAAIQVLVGQAVTEALIIPSSPDLLTAADGLREAVANMLVGIGVHNERMIGKDATKIEGPVVTALSKAKADYDAARGTTQ